MTQKVLLPLLFLFLAQAIGAQNAILRGRVTDAETAAPLADAAIVLGGTGKVAASGLDGRFVFEGLQPGAYMLNISHVGFQPLELEIIVKASATPSTDYALRRDPNSMSNPVAATGDIPTVTLEEADSETDGVSEIANVLNASVDVFQRMSAFGWSAFRFRERGYDGGLFQTYINGVPFNDLETGFTSFGEFGGLNDVFRLRNSTIGLDPAEFAFGGLGGATMIDTRAANQRKQLRVSYASSNRTYRNRIMATLNTGLMPGGWALSVSGSHRWAQEGFVEGTFMDAWAYFLSADKKFGQKHSLNLTVFGAPTKRGRAADSFQEMYDLAGSNFYNPNWGYWNGEKRNASVADNHQPTAILRYDWTPSPRTNLTAAFYGQTGKNNLTRTNFINGRNPAPDFNRRLPSSFENPEMAALQAEFLSADENNRQIDWLGFYTANRLNRSTITGADGIADNTVSGFNSVYIIANERSDNTELGGNVFLNHSFNSRLTLNGGAQYQHYTGKNYRTVEDLLGGDFWVDWDFFGNFDSETNLASRNSDLRVPNNVVREGEKFGYDYDENIRRAAGWLQLQYSLPRFQFFAAAEGLQTQMWRTGYMQSGRFPNNSLGDSEKLSFNTYTAKGGVTFKANGRNYLYVNAFTGTRAPLFRSAFFQARNRDLVVPNLVASENYGVEGGYLLRSPRFRARVTGYLTEFRNETESIFASLWSVGRVLEELDLGALGLGDDDATLEQPLFFGSTILQGVNRRHAGVEIGAEFRPTPSWVLTGGANLGQYIYTNRPEMYFSLDNGSAAAPIIPSGVVYQQNYYVPRTPQTTGTFGISYQGKDFWFASLSVNYAANLWYDFDRVRRTTRFVSGLTPDMPIWNTILDQQKAPDAYTLDFFGGKSWRILYGKQAYFINLNLGVNNILDNQNIQISGRDAYRNAFRNNVADPRFYTNELIYAFGRNYFASIAIRMQ
jgi:hypothetical protein